MFVSICSEELVAVHDNKDEYRYKIGICSDVDEDHPGCAVMQYAQDEGKRAVCAGKLDSAQIARSE